MTRFITGLAAAALVLGLAAGAQAQTLDKKGKCHGPDGKFAKMEVCKAAAPAPQHCRDAKTKKFAKCGAPNAEPVPAKK